MNALTPQEASKLREVIDGLDSAMTWLEADLRRLQQSLDAGIRLETICELNRILFRESTR